MVITHRLLGGLQNKKVHRDLGNILSALPVSVSTVWLGQGRLSHVLELVEFV